MAVTFHTVNYQIFAFLLNIAFTFAGFTRCLSKVTYIAETDPLRVSDLTQGAIVTTW